MSEDRGFEVVDKRRAGSGQGPGSGVSPDELDSVLHDISADPADETDGEEMDGEGPGGFPPVPLDPTELLHFSLGMFYQSAWVHLGLVVDPRTGEVNTDLPAARRAIDVVADLARHLEPHVGTQEKHEIQSALQTLRYNYVSKS